jgi:hypothetical protein
VKGNTGGSPTALLDKRSDYHYIDFNLYSHPLRVSGVARVI